MIRRIMYLIMVKVQKTTNNQLILTLPKMLADFKGIDKGTEVTFKEHTKNTIILEIVRKK
jgi:antitoxin component of MazEF toxin-antitoxin module